MLHIGWYVGLIFGPGFLSAQSGTLFVICDPASPGEQGSFGELRGAPLSYDMWEERSGNDLALDETYLYLADNPPLGSSFGLRIYDRSSRQLVHELPWTAVHVTAGQGLVMVTCHTPPFVRVLDPQQGFQELFSLDTTYFPIRPTKLVMAGGYAFAATSHSLSMIDLQAQDTVATFPVEAPVFPQAAYLHGIVASDTAVYLALSYATGAIRSSLLEFRIATQQLTVLLPEVYDFFAVLPVPVAARLYAFSYPTYYDLTQRQLVDSMAAPLSYPIVYDPREGTLWRSFPQIKALLRESPGQFSAEVQLPGNLVAFALGPAPLGTAISPAVAGLRIFPQPAKRALTLSWPQHPLQAARLFDAQGRMVWQGEWAGPATLQHCDLPVLVAGVYALEVTSPEHRHRQLVVIK